MPTYRLLLSVLLTSALVLGARAEDEDDEPNNEPAQEQEQAQEQPQSQEAAQPQGDPVDPEPRRALPRTAPAPRRATFAVEVLDSKTGAPIKGARMDVSITPSTDDCRTDERGYCGLEIPQGDHVVEVHANGYVHGVFGIVLRGNLQRQVRLVSNSPSGAPVPTRGALRGRLRIEGGAFVDDTGPVLPLMLHAGDLFGQYIRNPARVRAEMATIARAGYHGVRIWTIVNDSKAPNRFWDSKPAPHWGPSATPDYWTKLEQFFRDTAAAGLRLHVASGGLDGMTDAQENAYFDGLANLMTAVGPQHFALVEGLNEARDTGDRDDTNPKEIERLVNRVRSKHPSVLYALSAYTGHEDREVLKEWTPSWMQFYLVHGYRGGHHYDKLRHIFSLGYSGESPAVRRLGWQGEPTGPGKWVSATENAGELDNETLALMAAQSLICRQVWTYFSSPGVIFDEPFSSMPGFAAVPRLAAFIPKDVMRYPTLHHGGDTFRNTRVLQAVGEVRVDGALAANGDFAYVIYGPSGKHSLPVNKSFEGFLVHPGTGAVTPVVKKAGEKLDIEFLRGRLLIGKKVN